MAAAIRALMPPPAAADVAVDQSVELAAEPLLLARAARGGRAELLEELELLQPAASKIGPDRGGSRHDRL